MTELEILANLKIAYLKLEDILNNSDREQVSEYDFDQIENIMAILEIQYRELYKKIEKEQDLEYEKGILISNEIMSDYVTRSEDYDDQYLLYYEINKGTKWYEDLDFLLK